MLHRPDFEGLELSNQRAKLVNWWVQTTPRHKQTRFTGVITLKHELIITFLTDTGFTVNGQKLARTLDDGKAKFVKENSDGQNGHRPQLPVNT